MAEPADSSQATHIHQTHQFNILKLLAAKLAIHVLDDAEQRLLMICVCELYCTKASHIPWLHGNLVEQGTRARPHHAPMTRHTGLATDEDHVTKLSGFPQCLHSLCKYIFRTRRLYTIALCAELPQAIPQLHDHAHVILGMMPHPDLSK